MKNDKNNSFNTRNDNGRKDVSNREKHNPFKNVGDIQTKEETPPEEARSEQKRKETLTERD